MKHGVKTGFDRWVEEVMQNQAFASAYDKAEAEISIADRVASRVLGVKHAPSKPLPSDEWEATNDHLWDRILELARGDKAEFTHGGRHVVGPNDGKGFHPWPNPNGSAWAVKQYNLLGGGWKKKAREVTAAKLTKEWIAGIRRGWVKLMNPSISDWDDVERATGQLLKFVNALQEEVTFVRRGPFTSVPSMSDGKKLIDSLDALRNSIKDAKYRAEHWRKAYEGKLADRGFPVSDGERMFDLYKKDFASATETSVKARGGRDKTVSLTHLFDVILKILREDAARIEKDEAHGVEYEKANQPAFKNFDLNGLKVVVEDDSLTGSQVTRYIKFLDEARQRLQAKGLGKVWYGVVVIQCEGCGGVNHNTGGGVGGHYLIGPDTVGVFVRPTEFVVELIVHEFGHRYWFKHMDGEQRARFESFVKVRPTPRRPQPVQEAPIPATVTDKAKKNVDAELKKLEDAVSAFEKAKGKSFAKTIKEHYEPIARTGYDVDLTTAMHSSQADATITPEVKALLYEALEVHGKLKKFAGNLEEILTRINSHPDGVPGEELFKIERKRWVAECRQYIEEARASAYVYIDAATAAWNENEASKNEKARKDWEEKYENDSRPVLPVSDYGSRSTVEAFAEVFTYYVLDYKLDRDQVDSFKAVLKKASFKRASFAPDEWKWLERLRFGSVVPTLEGSLEDMQMERLRQRGLARCSGYSAHHRLWDITRKGYKVVTAGLAVELKQRVQEFLDKDPLQLKDLLELGNWIDQNFRVRSARVPKDLKNAKDTLERLVDTLKDFGRPGGTIYPDAVKDMVKNAFNRIEDSLPEIVKRLTTEGDAETGKEVLTELKLSNATFLNLASLSPATFKKYAEALNQVLDKLTGWRRKALTGNLKVELVGANRISVAGKYVVSDDTMLVRATPKILARAHGSYGAIDYILIHELGHRYDYKIGPKFDFEQPEWQTTRYSISKDGENFAELFALGHFKLTGNWTRTVEKFEALMTGKGA